MADPAPAHLRQRHLYHAPGPEAVKTLTEIRRRVLDLAVYVELSTPVGREQALALTKLQEAQMWANAAIAMREPLAE